MKRLFWTPLLAFNITLSSFAQTAADAFSNSQAALAIYYQCVKDYSLKMASTAAAPADIASGALSTCQGKHADYISASAAFVNLAQAESLGATVKDNARDFSISTVLDKRYEKRKDKPKPSSL